MSLPILSSRFFKTYQPRAEFWSRWKSQGPWSENSVPLYEWENLLFVGVSQPGASGRLPPRCLEVLCEADALKAFYQKLNQPLEVPDSEKTSFVLDFDMDELTRLHGGKTTEPGPQPPGEMLDLNPSDQAQLPPIPIETLTNIPQPREHRAESAVLSPQMSAEIEKIFSQMKNHFQKSMILRREGNALRPWKWDANFHPKPQALDQLISLGQPSPFRIASRTLNPYHGYVVTNEVNEKFFDEWNQTQIPDHLTVMPVVIEEQVVAMLVGLADSSVNQKASLTLAQKMGANLAQIFSNQPESLAS